MSLPGIKFLFFDVFGTCVDWRSTVVRHLQAKAPPTCKLTTEDWGEFAQQWRNSYGEFCHTFVPGESEWIDIDTHHHRSLIELLEKWNIRTMWNNLEIQDISRIWHFLDPWPDTAPGLAKLNTKYTTSTLSNGNKSLLEDLASHGNLPFNELTSAEDFKAYKPHPSVYKGAAAKLRANTNQCALVAAHLGDLEAAKALGMRAIYIERKGEDDHFNAEQVLEEKEKGWVDIWVDYRGENEAYGIAELADTLL